LELPVVATTSFARCEHCLATTRATGIRASMQILLAAAAQAFAGSTATGARGRQCKIEQAAPQLASRPVPVGPSGKHALVDRGAAFRACSRQNSQ
jgi:hypothetical protein